MESNVNNLSFEGSHPRLPWTWTSDVRRGSGPSDGCQGDQIQMVVKVIIPKYIEDSQGDQIEMVVKVIIPKYIEDSQGDI